MTGTGKTSIINRLSDLIDFNKKTFRFDAGDYCASDTKLKNDFSNSLNKHQNKPVILTFDEFQLARTKDEKGIEQNKNGIRAVWDILDSGKIKIYKLSSNSAFYLSDLEYVINKLETCIEQGVKIYNGVIVQNIEVFDTIFKSLKVVTQIIFGGETLSSNANTNKNSKIYDNLFVFRAKTGMDANLIYNLLLIDKKRFGSNEKTIEIFNKFNEIETLNYLQELLIEFQQQIDYDFSKSLIFVVGNLDEVYPHHKDINPDQNPDLFHKISLKIGITDIKKALQKRFRTEQIARLGNNHLIYPAFNSESYRKLISMELGKIQLKSKTKFNLDIDFDNSVNDIIYKEGMFPTQGTRPIFTTIQTLVDSYICKILLDIINSKNSIYIQKVFWSYNYEKNIYNIKFLNKENKVLFSKEYEVKIKIDNLRKSNNDDEQVFTSIHESGHAILSAIKLRILPNEILSKSILSEVGGMTVIELPISRTKEVMRNDIITMFGGYEAEKLIFGEDMLTNGSSNDIKVATEKAILYVKKYGMNGNSVLIENQNENINGDMLHLIHEREDILVKELVEECRKEAGNVLKENKLLLLKIGEYLSKETKMDKIKVKEYVLKYNNSGIKESDNYFLDKDNYYKLKDKIKNEILLIEGSFKIKNNRMLKNNSFSSFQKFNKNQKTTEDSVVCYNKKN